MRKYFSRSFPLRLHNKAEVLLSDPLFFDALLENISQAKQFIHLQVYIFDADKTGNLVADKLIEAAKRGVRVFVVIDAYGSNRLPEKFIGRLEEAGIFVKKYSPMFISK